MKKLIFAAAVLGTMFIGSNRASAQVVSGRISLPGISIGVNDGPYYRYGHHPYRPRYYAYGGEYYMPQQGYVYVPDRSYGQGYGQQGTCQPQYPKNGYQERGEIRERYDDQYNRGDRYENQQDNGERGYEQEQNQQGQGYEQQEERYEQPQEEQGYNEQNHSDYNDGYNER